jgi:hypothetical protein
MAERPKSSPLMGQLLKCMVYEEHSILELEKVLEYEKRGDIGQLREKVKAYRALVSDAIDSMVNDPELSPYTPEGKESVRKSLYATMALKELLPNVGKYGRDHSAHWTDALGKSIYKFVNGKMPQVLEEQLLVIDELYAKPVLYEAKPKKKPAAAEEPAMTPAGNVVAIVAVLALGFVMLNGLDNMQAASSAGALPSLNTGFFLLPGGPFVSSLQMVLFMLASAVAVMYLAGKALGEW